MSNFIVCHLDQCHINRKILMVQTRTVSNKIFKIIIKDELNATGGYGYKVLERVRL